MLKIVRKYNNYLPRKLYINLSKIQIILIKEVKIIKCIRIYNKKIDSSKKN